MKRSIGIVDTIAFPRDDPANMPYWSSLIGSPAAPPGTTMYWLANTMVTDTVKWSWTVNSEIPAGGSTITGTRTISGMWRTSYNTEWGQMTMKAVDYEHDTTTNRWSDGFWLQLGQGEDKPLLEQLLDRINLQAQDWELTYKSHPANNEVPGYNWVVDSTMGGMLGGTLGWRERDMAPPTEAVWGWGLQTMIKDFPNNVLKTITIGRTVGMVMSGSTFSENTVLYRGTLDSPVGNSFNIRTLDAPRGVDASLFRERASLDHPPGGQSFVEKSKDGAMMAQILELTARLAELERPRQDGEGREKWNKDDAGPRPSAEALVGGAGPLDRQGIAPLQAELGTGAAQALITKQAVQPLSGAWEGERQA